MLQENEDFSKVCQALQQRGPRPRKLYQESTRPLREMSGAANGPDPLRRRSSVLLTIEGRVLRSCSSREAISLSTSPTYLI